MLYVKNLYKSYLSGSKEYPVLKKINLHIGVGEFVAVMGPSGSGKKHPLKLHFLLYSI